LARASRPLHKEDLDGAELLLLTSLPTLVQMVAGGAGVTLLPEPVENRRGQLRLRRFAAPGPGRTLALAWRSGSPAAEVLRRIAAVLREKLPSRATRQRLRENAS
jgi:LysR family hydrogen peroxide-inducible transcriptional activator